MFLLVCGESQPNSTSGSIHCLFTAMCGMKTLKVVRVASSRTGLSLDNAVVAVARLGLMLPIHQQHVEVD